MSHKWPQRFFSPLFKYREANLCCTSGGFRLLLIACEEIPSYDCLLPALRFVCFFKGLCQPLLLSFLAFVISSGPKASLSCQNGIRGSITPKVSCAQGPSDITALQSPAEQTYFLWAFQAHKALLVEVKARSLWEYILGHTPLLQAWQLGTMNRGLLRCYWRGSAGMLVCLHV